MAEERKSEVPQIESNGVEKGNGAIPVDGINEEGREQAHDQSLCLTAARWLERMKRRARQATRRPRMYLHIETSPKNDKGPPIGKGAPIALATEEAVRGIEEESGQGVGKGTGREIEGGTGRETAGGIDRGIEGGIDRGIDRGIEGGTGHEMEGGTGSETGLGTGRDDDREVGGQYAIQYLIPRVVPCKKVTRAAGYQSPHTNLLLVFRDRSRQRSPDADRSGRTADDTQVSRVLCDAYGFDLTVPPAGWADTGETFWRSDC
eukprot:766213-Hanusia_phi.AAC.2